MASRESMFYDRIVADATIMAILTGGVYKAETTGIEGINLETTSAAFDATTFYLKPCCMVRQRGLVPDRQIMDPITQVVSASQVVECWLYEDKTYTAIDAAINRLKVLFVGYRFTDSFEIDWVNTLDRLRDKGALKGYSLAKIDFEVRSIWRP